MLNVVLICSIVFIFVWYDVALRFRIMLRPGRAQELLRDYSSKTIGRIFSLLRAYGAFELVYEDRSGRPLPERFLLVANHQSLMDIPVLMFLVPQRQLRFVAKKELGGGIPLVSLLLRSQGHALIRRSGDPAQARKSLRRFVKRSRHDGSCPVIFAEGHRSDDGRVGPFYTAGVRRVLDFDSLPMVVAAIDGGWKIARIGELLRNLRGTRYQVRVLEVFAPPRGKQEIAEAVQRARENIAAAIVDMRGTESR